jgi:fibronectin type 3 domain-containing protein
LVAAYGFEAGSGATVVDVSGNNNVGTLNTGTTWSTAGRFGNALQYNGTTSGVTVPDAPSLDLTTALTLEAWVYPTVSLSGWRVVIGKDVDRYYLMGSSGNNTPAVGGTFTVGGNTNLFGPTGLAVNTWTHLAATFDGATLRLYANGLQVASQTQTGAFTTSTGALTLGYNVYGERFTGLIDEVRVYNRALSLTEIQTDMGTPVGTPGPRITITQPAEGALVAGTDVPVAYVTSGDQTEVNHVHFQLDSLPEVMDLTLDGSYQLTGVAAGAHTLRGYLVRSDHSKITGTDATPINFSTTVPDTTPPTVTLTAPVNGSTVSGVVTLSATATDAVGVVGVQFKLDGADAGPEDLTFPYSLNLNTAGYVNGPHVVSAVARDVGGNTTISDAVTVTVSNTDPNDPATVGQWGAPFDWPIVGLHAALLPTGKILSWTNFTDGGGVQLWNPNNNAFTQIPYTAANLFCAGHTFLADGRLLVSGGHLGTFVGINNTTLFDPWTEQWVTAKPMSYARWYPTSTTLADGRVLTVSGAIDCVNCAIPGDPHDGLADIGEIYNPATNSHTELASAPKRLEMYPHMFVLPDGRVLASSTNEDPIRAAVLDLTTNSWADVPGGVVDGGSAAMYLPGKVMKSGSAWNPDYPVRAAAPTTYVLDMTSPSPTWRQTPSMAFARTEHNLTLLPDGTVLATGGSRDSNVFDLAPAVYEAELWSPSTETWRTLSKMTVPRMYHSIALLLPDARVITFGSGTFGIDQLTAQVFSPPYLFKGPRPVVTSAPGAASYGDTFTVQTPDASRIASVALMGLGSVTHAFNANQRYLPLTFQQSAGGIDVTLPQNANLAPPGYYMLFLVDTNGVPSIAPMIRVTPVPDNLSPSAPGTLAAVASGNQIALSWGAATDNVGVTGYRVERCQGTGCSNFTQIATPAGTTYTDTGLTSGTTYSYRVRATDAATLLGPYSNIASATIADTTAPSAPGTLTAAVNGTDITLTWGAATDNVGVTGYRLERCQGASCTTFTQIATPPGLTYTDSGLNSSTTYRYRVRASDAGGLLGAYSNIASATTGTIPDTTPPSAPGTLTATATGTQIALSWGAATDNVGVTGYRVERCQGTGCSNFTQIATPAGTTYTDTGLTSGTTYSYRVRATDAATLLGPYSNIASARPERCRVDHGRIPFGRY